ncbi:Lrp/AsnC family transcriptional regulator [Sphingomonas sp. LaA6.9]|nr:Lrp/AsnC family transcriptional regulator [Sphingomonas sp. LaA6.9]
MTALERNGRITKAELSEAVGLSATPCSMRISKLEAAGLIKGYHADVDLEQVGNLSQFAVIVSIREWTPDRARQFETIVAGIPQIVECDAVFGSVDYMMRIYAAHAQHYREIMEPLLAIELDYATFPISRSVRAPHEVSMTALLAPGSR